MCGGSKTKDCLSNSVMEGKLGEQKDGFFLTNSNLLELAAANDLTGFVCEVEEKGFDVDEISLWYGRRIGSRKMGFQERTPLMIASMYGSTEVLKYIIETGKVDVNRTCSPDGATALHCAAAGGSDSSVEVVKALLEASADVNSLDAGGNKAGDLISPCLKCSDSSRRRKLDWMLNGGIAIVICEAGDEEKEKPNGMIKVSKEGTEKKEYPVDVSLPDINNGIYGTDEFRMYNFKVKPCSRAYSHDWTECPFVHPGENARRRDPKKYNYSCVPCPEFKKGTCAKGDSCEYAHGVFECWLHPAQYRTRLCKDETGCSRKVCFFAHRPEELRPLYASTGSAIPSPQAVPFSSVDMATMSPLSLNSSSLLLSSTSTPPMSPSVACSSPMSSSLWQNKANLTPPALQLPGSRLKTAVSARDLGLEMELLGLETIRTQQQQQQRQQLIDEMCGLSSPSYNHSRIGDLNPTNLDGVFGSLDPTLVSQLQCLSPKVKNPSTSQLQSPTGLQMRQNVNQLRSNYPSNLSSSPMRKPSAFGFDTSGAVAAAVMNSRSAAFAKRSQSFVDRGAAGHRPGFTAAATSASLALSNLSDWSSPDGKLDWGFNGDEMNKLKKSASFGLRTGNSSITRTATASLNVDEPDVSWVHSLVKDAPSAGAGGVHEMIPPWVDQLYIDREQIMA